MGDFSIWHWLVVLPLVPFFIPGVLPALILRGVLRRIRFTACARHRGSLSERSRCSVTVPVIPCRLP